MATDKVSLNGGQSGSYGSGGKWAVLLAAFLGWMFDGLEMGIFPQIARKALTALATKSDEQTIAFWHQVIDASFLFGAALGGLAFGWLGDKIGRVKAMAASILIYSAFTGMLYFVTAPIHIAVLRFIAAVGMGGEWALGVALVMEVWDAKYRPLLAGLIGAASNVGFTVVGVVGVVWPVTETSWRFVALIGAAPALLTFLIMIFVPESHKWQESQKKAPSKPLRELFGDRRLTVLAIMAICFASVALLGTWGAVQKIPAWAAGMPGATKYAAGTSQILSGIGAIVACLIAPLVAALLNRRIAYFLLCLVSLITCQLLFRTFTEYTFGFLVMTFIVGGVSAAFYGWLPLYLPELFPTRVRATAQGIAFNSGRILAGIGAISGGLLSKEYAKMGALISLIYVVGMIIIWFAPETKGKPLPE